MLSVFLLGFKLFGLVCYIYICFCKLVICIFFGLYINIVEIYMFRLVRFVIGMF